MKKFYNVYKISEMYMKYIYKMYINEDYGTFLVTDNARPRRCAHTHKREREREGVWGREREDESTKSSD